MREIKFRGQVVNGLDKNILAKDPKDVNSITWCFMKGGWVYGSLIIRGDKHFIEVSEMVLGEMVIFLIAVNPETIGQFTGRKDMKGVDIYEGDIVLYEEQKWIIENRFYMVIIPDSRAERHYDSDWVEIIGNVHDNPELLEQK